MAYIALSEIRSRVRDLLNESSAGVFTDDEIDRWINDGQVDLATKALCLERSLPHQTASSTRTVDLTNIPNKHVVKILSVEYMSSIDVAVKTLNDSVLSGVPILIKINDHSGNSLYLPAYPDIAAEAGATSDDVIADPYYYDFAALSGDPLTMIMQSNSTPHYFKAYPDAASLAGGASGAIIPFDTAYNGTLSGTPRVAKITIGAATYYFKVYPIKS